MMHRDNGNLISSSPYSAIHLLLSLYTCYSRFHLSFLSLDSLHLLFRRHAFLLSSLSRSVVSDCNPMDCPVPGLPVPHCLPEFAPNFSLKHQNLSPL